MLNADAYAVNGAKLPRKCGLCRAFLALRPAKAFLASKDAVTWPGLSVYTRCSFKHTKMEGPDFPCLVQRRAQRTASAMDIDEAVVSARQRLNHGACPWRTSKAVQEVWRDQRPRAGAIYAPQKGVGKCCCQLCCFPRLCKRGASGSLGLRCLALHPNWIPEHQSQTSKSQRHKPPLAVPPGKGSCSIRVTVRD